jgi:hypothetical protein
MAMNDNRSIYGNQDNQNIPTTRVNLDDAIAISKINSDIVQKYNTILKLQEQQNYKAIEQLKLKKDEVNTIMLINTSLGKGDAIAQAVTKTYKEINDHLTEQEVKVKNINGLLLVGTKYQRKFSNYVTDIIDKFSILSKFDDIPFIGGIGSMATQGISKFAGGLGRILDIFSFMTSSAKNFMAVMSVGLKSLGIGLLLSGLAAIVKVFDVMRKFNVGGIGTAIARISSLISVLSARLELVIASVGQKLGPVLSGIFRGIEKVIVPIFNVLTTFITSFVDGLATAFGDTNEMGKTFLSIFSSIGQILSGLTPAISFLAKVIGTVLGVAIKVIVEPLKWLMKALAWLFGATESFNKEASKTSNISNRSINYNPIYNVTANGSTSQQIMDTVTTNEVNRARMFMTSR